MKKAFSLFYFIFVVSGLFVSCTNEDDLLNNNGDDSPNNNTLLGDVHFGNDSWNIWNIKADNNQTESLQATFTSNNIAQYPCVYLNATSSPGTYHGTIDSATWSYGTNNISALYYCTAADSIITIENEDGTIFGYAGDWWAKTVDYIVSDFDATGNTISFNLAAEMFKFQEYRRDFYDGVPPTTTLDLFVKDASITIDNNGNRTKFTSPSQIKNDLEISYIGNVEFGNDRWPIKAVNGVSFTLYDEIKAWLFSDKVARYPHVYLSATDAIGTYKGNFDTATWEYGTDAIYALYYSSSADEVITLDYGGGNVVEVGDWWAKTVDYTVSAFDATGATISFTLAADMFKFEDTYNSINGILDVDNAETTKLKMDVKDATFTVDNTDYGKAMFNKIARPNQLKGTKIVKQDYNVNKSNN